MLRIALEILILILLIYYTWLYISGLDETYAEVTPLRQQLDEAKDPFVKSLIQSDIDVYGWLPPQWWYDAYPRLRYNALYQYYSLI